MKMTKKIISCMISLVILVSMFSLITVNAAGNLDDITLRYEFDNEENGNGEGRIILSNIDSTLQSAITSVYIYWGASATERLGSYYSIANGGMKLEYSDNELVYEFGEDRLIPNGATHIIADVTTSDDEREISFAIPAGKQLNAPQREMLYSMVWASDIHTTSGSIYDGSQVDEMFDDIVTLSQMSGKKFKGAVFNGDISDKSIDYQYEIVEDFIDKYQINFPIYYNSGNHDTSVTVSKVTKDLTEGAKVAFDKRFAKLKDQFGITFDHSDPWNYETYINGQHHIFLSTPYGTYYDLNDASKKWLEEKLSYDEKSGVPTFVYSHLPYRYSGLSSMDGYMDNGFGELINRHPSAIVITSHIHLDHADEALVNYNVVGGIPYIDTGCVKAFTSTSSEQSNKCGNILYVEVYPDKVIVRSRNVKDKKWVPHGEHIISIANYGNTIEQNFTITGNNDNMAADTVLTAKLDGETVNTELYDVTWSDMTGTLLGTGATYTVVTPNESVSAKIVRKSDSAYAYAVARYIAPASGDDSGDSTLPDISDDTTVKYFGDIVYLSGNAGVGNAGEEATLVLMEKDKYPTLRYAKYFGHCTVAADGGYQFKFKASDMSSEDVLLVKVGNDGPLAYEVLEKGTDDSVAINNSLDSQNRVCLSMVNKYEDEGDVKIIIATFMDERQLEQLKIADYNLEFYENGEPQEWLSDEAIDTEENNEVYLWKDFNSLIPLSGKKQFEPSE